MSREYSLEFKEKAVYQIIGMVRPDSCSPQRAYTDVGELLGVSPTMRGVGTETVLQYVMALTRQMVRQWKKSLGRLRRENRELRRANGI